MMSSDLNISAANVRSVSVLGTGNMGSAIVESLLKAGYRTFVWNRTVSKAERLVEQGAILSESPTSCIASSSLTLICLVSNEAVLDVLRAISDFSGSTVINFTNGTPRDVSEAATLVQTGQESAYIHGAIMVPPGMIGSEQAVTLYAGSQDTFTESLPVLKTLGTPRFVSEAPTYVSILDNALLSILGGLFSGYVQALALVRKGGLSEVEFTNSFVVPLLGGFISFLPRIASQVLERKYEVDRNGSPIAMQLEGIRNIMETSKQYGVCAKLLEGMQQLMTEAVKNGKGNEGVAGLVDLL